MKVTVRPSSFSYSHFLNARSKQKIMNYLFCKAQHHDYEFEDEMFRLLNSIKRLKRRNRIDAVFLRTDYMMDGNEIKQVEINTISPGLYMLGPCMNKVHAMLYDNVEISDSDTKLLSFFELLRETYKSMYSVNNSICLMVDEKTTSDVMNYSEKALLIRGLKERGIVMLHVTMDDIRKGASFDRLGDKTDDLLESGCMTPDHRNEKHKTTSKESEESADCETSMFFYGMPVFMVYYRWFYNFNQYDDVAIRLRTKIETSVTISVPTVELQIITSKLFQKQLCDKSFLSRFLDKEEIEDLCTHFGEFRSPGDYNGSSAWILKSVNEGGGYNVYADTEIDSYSKSKSHVLMKRYKPPMCQNRFIDDTEDRNVINEIGIFGILVAADGNILVNEEAGYICRTKDEGSKEGGVCDGTAALDSICKL